MQRLGNAPRSGRTSPSILSDGIDAQAAGKWSPSSFRGARRSTGYLRFRVSYSLSSNSIVALLFDSQSFCTIGIVYCHF